MALVVVDWRQADSAQLATLYADEIERWSRVLGWETAGSWDHIELGRRLGTVPGLLALDSTGAVAGWTFYLVHRGVLQIGGIVAVSEPATVALLDGIFASEVAAQARSATVFAFTDAPGLAAALAQRGFIVGGYDYLMKSFLGPGHVAGGAVAEASVDPVVLPELRHWRDREEESIAALLSIAYPGADGVRPFAPGGTTEEWQEYVGQLVSAAGCGTIMPEGCYVVPTGPGRIAGVVLVTRLASATAHIAQIAVDPQVKRRGLGRLLVNAACASASAAGCDRITLLVESRNLAARRLYEMSGFQAVARFVSAGLPQPLRLTNVAVRGRTAVRP
jgi:ribosomal protein S18 acetylase RimI-like enzyme